MNVVDSNPFLDPRAADSLNSADYVRCFSPYLVPHLLEVFAQGNVILKGTIGCGKSMILRLFDPKVRIAYYAAKKEFPVPKNYQYFIGTGINLSKSGVLDIVQRMPANPTEEDIQRLAAIFVDYLNYWLVDDLLKSCTTMISNKECFAGIIDPSRLDDFIKLLVKHSCWCGYLLSCKTLEDVQSRIDSRLNHLRNWANWNIDALDKSIQSSKAAIGEPVASSADCMKRSGLLQKNAVAFVRIDQVEELLHKDPPQFRVTEEFRSRIYLAVGRRDGRVSYRIGTRTYDEPPVMPGGRALEESRDYVITAFDSILRREENARNWVFRGFAEDVFRRRLTSLVGNTSRLVTSKRSLFRHYFGSSPTPQALLEHIIVRQNTPVESLINVDALPTAWAEYIRAVYRKETALSESLPSTYRIDPLNAILAFAWAQQRGGNMREHPRYITDDPPRLDAEAPWTVWWKKERVKQALLQLAASHKQRIIWWGSQDVLALSSNNITLFLSLCRETWELWQRELRASKRAAIVEEIPENVQQVAIENVSKRWHQNLAKQPGRPGGDIRIRFLDRMFADLRIRLLKDKAMQYPGANGFSILNEELIKHPGLHQLISECVAWGDLERIEHTSKHASDKIRGTRYKYYANSILTPHYQLFESHIKEPRYLSPDEVLKHAFRAKALPQSRAQKSSPSEQAEIDFDGLI